MLVISNFSTVQQRRKSRTEGARGEKLFSFSMGIYTVDFGPNPSRAYGLVVMTGDFDSPNPSSNPGGLYNVWIQFQRKFSFCRNFLCIKLYDKGCEMHYGCAFSVHNAKALLLLASLA